MFIHNFKHFFPYDIRRIRNPLISLTHLSLMHAMLCPAFPV